MTLKELVFDSLNNAVENEYTDWLRNSSVKAIADDLTDCVAGLEDRHPDELIPFVEDWLDEQVDWGADE